MPNKTTQILKEKETWEMRFHALPENKALKRDYLGYGSYNIWFSAIQRFFHEELKNALSQQQQEDYRQIEDLFFTENGFLREDVSEILSDIEAIAEKRGTNE